MSDPVPATVPMTEIPMAEPIVADVTTSSYEAMPTVKEVPKGEEAMGYASSPEGAVTKDPASLPIMSTPKLVVIRGQRLNVEYPLYAGDNYIGRTDEKPVDIDLDDQESSDRVWCSRQHAKVVVDENTISIEDLGSQNGTFVNRARIFPGQVRPLQGNDVVQIGTVQMKLKVQ